jgi:hypothetical protein
MQSSVTESRGSEVEARSCEYLGFYNSVFVNSAVMTSGKSATW